MSAAPAAARLTEEAWFAALGVPLGAGECDDIDAYLRGFGLAASAPPWVLADWDELAALLRRPSAVWWAREEAERQRLEALVEFDPTDPEWIKLNDFLHGAAAVAAARFGCVRADLIKVAAGAASYAAYHHLLAAGAGVPDAHPFERKYALFAAGRWPLGAYDGRFAIF